MPIKDILILSLQEKQEQLMRRYEDLEEIQRECPELYAVCQREMDKVDGDADRIRREIYELGKPEEGDCYAGKERGYQIYTEYGMDDV